MSNSVPTQLNLPNGEVVKVNDHVYWCQPWARRDSVPFSIGRIMEFFYDTSPELAESSAAANSSARGKTRHQSTYDSRLRIRINTYYRPPDVLERAPVNPDVRYLYAAIFSDVAEFSWLRQKCYVQHRDRITDLAGWKRRPDRFYFNKLFDPYVKREFEVFPAKDVRNVPENVREVLVDRYEYVVAEKEVIPDLTDDMRTCETCTKWASAPESLPCDRCHKYFHLQCVSPPLNAKPTRGYGWTCAACSRAREEPIEIQTSSSRRAATPQKPRSTAQAHSAPRPRGRPRKDRTIAEKEESLPMRCFKGWPWRYFGLYTRAEDTLDADDPIFPRMATRIGPKYQAVCPRIGRPPLKDTEERGESGTLEIMSCVDKMTEQEVTEFEACKSKLAASDKLRSHVDWLTEVTFRLSEKYLAKQPMKDASMKNVYRLRKWKKDATRYIDREWTEQERVAFEDGIAQNGPELRSVRDEVGTRDIFEVVRFYGHWKNEHLGSEWEAQRRGQPPAPTPDVNMRRAGESDDEGSFIAKPRKDVSCGACRTKESKVWMKGPKALVPSSLCEPCGMKWRKYADLKQDDSKKDEAEKEKEKEKEKGKKRDREGTPVQGAAKRAKTSHNSTATPPPGGSAHPQNRCTACHKNGPVGRVLKCTGCGVRMHAGTCGVIPEPGLANSWLCDLCENERSGEASLNTDCVLCPPPKAPKKNAKGKETEKDSHKDVDTFLRACKPTEGQCWAHVLCSVFIPEVAFSDASRLRLVEGVSTVPQERWETRCVICKREGGAVVRCVDCVDEYHVSCAWQKGHKFGFEIRENKAAQRASIQVSFKNGSGAMHAIIRCKGHDNMQGNKVKFFDICETNEFGETALQVYCRNYKQVHVAQSHGLLRKAQRLDAVLRQPVLPPVAPQGPCAACSVSVTPAWHPSPRGCFCHVCWVERESHRGTNGHAPHPEAEAMDVDRPTTNGVHPA
ncbi:hypothetical protein PENSPDRAFT_685129 [Peniophora sp. CONT]|nr:hypothetical protein PENSPDRAFT_685129 [Peniophora sp. CONT]